MGGSTESVKRRSRLSTKSSPFFGRHYIQLLSLLPYHSYRAQRTKSMNQKTNEHPAVSNFWLINQSLTDESLKSVSDVGVRGHVLRKEQRYHVLLWIYAYPGGRRSSPAKSAAGTHIP
jgi:hypothetical protein